MYITHSTKIKRNSTSEGLIDNDNFAILGLMQFKLYNYKISPNILANELRSIQLSITAGSCVQAVSGLQSTTPSNGKPRNARWWTHHRK